jgi:predicted enzyme related to lactoylglutathione lyase
MPNPVVHFEALGPDGPALIDFYGKAFGWSINADNPMGYGIVDNGGEGINGGIGQAPPEGNGHHLTWYVWVPDIDAALETIEGLGGKTINPKMEVPGGPTVAHFEDPGGNFVGLVTGGPEEMGADFRS